MNTRVRNKLIILVDERAVHPHNSTILLPDDYVTIKYKSRRGEYATESRMTAAVVVLRHSLLILR